MRLKYSKIRLGIYLIALIIVYLIPLSFVEGRSFCVLYNLFDITCVGCGVSRGLFNIIHLNFREACNYNPLSFFWFILFGSIILKDIFKITYLLTKKEAQKQSIIEKITFSLILKKD